MMQRLRLLVLGIVGFLGVFFAHGSWLNRLLAFTLCGVLSADSGLCMAQIAKFSGQANATTPILLSQRSSEFDDPPDTPPVNTPSTNTPAPFPFDAGPNFIRPDFGGNPPNQLSQRDSRISFRLIEPGKIRVTWFEEEGLTQYFAVINSTTGINVLESITTNLRTGDPTVDGSYYIEFSQDENFLLKITKNNEESLILQDMDSEWRMIFTRGGEEIFNTDLEKSSQNKGVSKISSYIYSREVRDHDSAIILAANPCPDKEIILPILDNLGNMGKEVVNKFNFFAKLAGKLPRGDVAPVPTVGVPRGAGGLSPGEVRVVTRTANGVKREVQSIIEEVKESGNLSDCPKDEDNVAEQPSQPSQNPSPPTPPDIQASRGNNSRPTGPLKQGRSYGDPHIATFDGYSYNFQTVGEFILVQSQDGAFQVQTRQGRVPGKQVSLNIAAAMKVGNSRVAVYAKDFPDGNANTPVWIDGRPVAVDRTLELPGGGSIQGGNDSYIVQFPTGEQVGISRISVAGMSFMNVNPGVIEQADRYMGLLGNLNNNKDDDLQTRDGRVIPSKNNSTYGAVRQLLGNLGPIPLPLSQLETAFFDQLYKEFGDSWRVTQAESLFTYAPNQSTDTFTNRNFPNSYASLASLLPADIRRAEQICQQAGVPGDLLEGCLFDVAATGEGGFVQAALDNVLDQVRDRVQNEIRNLVPVPIPLPF